MIQSLHAYPRKTSVTNSQCLPNNPATYQQYYGQQVCVKLPTSAINVTLLTFAAECCAVALHCSTTTTDTIVSPAHMVLSSIPTASSVNNYFRSNLIYMWQISTMKHKHIYKINAHFAANILSLSDHLISRIIESKSMTLWWSRRNMFARGVRSYVNQSPYFATIDSAPLALKISGK